MAESHLHTAVTQMYLDGAVMPPSQYFKSLVRTGSSRGKRSSGGKPKYLWSRFFARPEGGIFYSAALYPQLVGQPHL